MNHFTNHNGSDRHGGQAQKYRGNNRNRLNNSDRNGESSSYGDSFDNTDRKLDFNRGADSSSSDSEGSRGGQGRSEEYRYVNRESNGSYGRGRDSESRAISWRPETSRSFAGREDSGSPRELNDEYSMSDSYGTDFSGSSDIYGHAFDTDSGFYNDNLTGNSNRQREETPSRGAQFRGRMNRNMRSGSQAISSFDSESTPIQSGRGSRDSQERNFSGLGPMGYSRPKERIIEEVNDALTDCPDLDASGIEVDCERGEVILRGTVPSRQCKRHAEILVDTIRGVNDVRNELRVAREDRAEQARIVGKPNSALASSSATSASESGTLFGSAKIQSKETK